MMFLYINIMRKRERERERKRVRENYLIKFNNLIILRCNKFKIFDTM